MFKALLKASTTWWLWFFGAFGVFLAAMFNYGFQTIWNAVGQGITWVFAGAKFAMEAYWEMLMTVGESAMQKVLLAGGVDPAYAEPVFDALDMGNRYFPIAETLVIVAIILTAISLRSLTKFILAFSPGGI